jgi:hypothetical protein
VGNLSKLLSDAFNIYMFVLSAFTFSAERKDAQESDDKR